MAALVADRTPPATASSEKGSLMDQNQQLSRLADLLAKQDITEAISRYARAMDRLDAELAKSVFHPDARVDYGEAVFQGSAYAFIDWVLGSHVGLVAHTHQMSTISISVDGDSAGSETYADVAIRHRGEGELFTDITTFGRYIDRWECRNDHWAIVERRYLNDFQSTVSSPGSKHPMTGRRDRSDPSYEVLAKGTAPD